MGRQRQVGKQEIDRRPDRVATQKLRLICNLKSCWIVSIMGRLPTNKLLSGGK